MSREQEREKKNRQIALAASLGIHIGLFLLLFFLVAWRAPNPPLPEYGIELNFGLDSEGGGDIQPTEQPGTEEPSQEETKPVESVLPEESKEPEQTDVPVISKIESPVAVKEEKKEQPVIKPKETIEKPKAEVEKKVSKEASTAVASETKKGKDVASQGDDKGKTGDKGSPQGKPNLEALYGTPGGGGGGDGISLSMFGWEWADKPKIPELPDNEDGKIVFEIECDETGEIVQIKTLQRGLSPRAEQLLKNEIRKNSLVRTSAGKVPERSKGTIVFVLKTK